MQVHRCVAVNVAAILTILALAGCQSMDNKAPIRTASGVDLERFQGDWYVIGNIPTFIERDIYNALESYQLAPDGRVNTTFSFNKGSFDGPQKIYNPTGFVRDDESNAIWDMQFVWPFKAEYLIVYLDPDYQTTIIGRTKRDYLWIMARTPMLEEAEYEKLVEIAVAQGYARDDIRRVPQEPLAERDLATDS
jgi:apolipoprotein D and lipocalin family protein